MRLTRCFRRPLKKIVLRADRYTTVPYFVMLVVCALSGLSTPVTFFFVRPAHSKRFIHLSPSYVLPQTVTSPKLIVYTLARGLPVDSTLLLAACYNLWIASSLGVKHQSRRTATTIWTSPSTTSGLFQTSSINCPDFIIRLLLATIIKAGEEHPIKRPFGGSSRYARARPELLLQLVPVSMTALPAMIRFARKSFSA